MLRIKLVKSPIGNTARNRATVQALGLRKIRQVVEHEDSASVRGMVHRVKHLLQIEISDEPAKAKVKRVNKKPTDDVQQKAPKMEAAPVVEAPADPKPTRSRKKAEAPGEGQGK
jgi:large subunit ribosomal protein L30